MGTRFRTMLAPIGMSTGDGRRFADGAIDLADVPMPFEWARSREGGHDGAVVVGAVQEAKIMSVKDAVAGEWVSADAAKGLDSGMVAVWAKGEMFDGVSREDMPRLAEDVAEAMHLTGQGTLGPSVDLDTFEGVPVLAGTDEEVTWQRLEEIYEETGEEPKVELLITSGRVRAATLVSLPAFAETSRPLELITAEETSEDVGQAAALVASVGVMARPSVDAFALPSLDKPTPITWDFEAGRVFGHIATWKTCHVGYSDVCVTAPRDDEATGYASFNRHPVETDNGTVWAGRITVGGRHPGLSLTAAATMKQYDGKTVAAHVRAYSDEHGIVVAGVIAPDLDMSARSVLARRKVSGDWRDTPAGLSLVEVLALSPGPYRHSEPGFPVPGTFTTNGRQTALTAALGPDPIESKDPDGSGPTTSWADVRAEVRAALAEDRRVQAERELAARERAELARAFGIEVDRERAALADLVGATDA